VYTASMSNTETKTPPYFTLQAVVQRSGLSEHTLRYYERIGLLDRVKRDSSSGRRRYTTEDAQNIELLACLRTTGMSIEDMRTYFALPNDGKAAADQQLALFEAQKSVGARAGSKATASSLPGAEGRVLESCAEW
jgi:MerR family transcriptional regulator, aldehyde-responsive regulator